MVRWKVATGADGLHPEPIRSAQQHQSRIGGAGARVLEMHGRQQLARALVLVAQRSNAPPSRSLIGGLPYLSVSLALQSVDV